MRKIVFVCTGNTCRSPMAEGLFNALAAESGLDVRAESCGLSVSTQKHASDNAIEAAARLGADISAHVPRQISGEILENAEGIYCMTGTQAAMLDRLGLPMPVEMLDKRDIIDPFGGDIFDYMAAAEQIRAAVAALTERLKNA